MTSLQAVWEANMPEPFDLLTVFERTPAPRPVMLSDEHGLPVMLVNGTVIDPIDVSAIVYVTGSGQERRFWDGTPLTPDEQRLADEAWEIAGPYEHTWLTDDEYAFVQAARRAGLPVYERKAERPS